MTPHRTFDPSRDTDPREACTDCAHYRLADPEREPLRRHGYGQCAHLSPAHWLPPYRPCRFAPSRFVPRKKAAP